MVDHYSHRIQNVIQKELFKAQKSIKIAVAWFTNDLLFQPLLLKLQTGVIVELILNKDDINNSEDNDINFIEFIESGGVLHWNDSQRLMHEKFCIIDDDTVIYGTYNWTNKAEYNDESIAISHAEQNTTDFYLTTFKELCSKYPAEASERGKSCPIKNQNVNSANERAKTNCVKEKIVGTATLIFRGDRYAVYERVDEESPNKHEFYISNCLCLNIKTPESIALYGGELVFSAFKSVGNNIFLYRKGWLVFNKRTSFKLISESANIELGPYDSRSFTIRDLPNGKWGLLNYEGKVLVPYAYDEIKPWEEYFGTSYWILKRNGRYGLSADNKIVWDCVFDELTDSIAPIKFEGKYGLMNSMGDIIVETKYSEMIIDKESSSILRKIRGGFPYVYITKDIEGRYGICIPYLKIEKEGFLDGKELFDKIGIPEFDICEHQKDIVLENLRISLILDIVYEVVDFGTQYWSKKNESEFISETLRHNARMARLLGMGESYGDFRNRLYTPESRYINAPFFYLAHPGHICLDTHCLGTMWRACSLQNFSMISKQLFEDDILIVSKNTKALFRMDRCLYFCILQVVNIPLNAVRFVEFNFAPLYYKSVGGVNKELLNGKGEVTIQIEQLYKEYLGDIIGILTQNRTRNAYIKLSKCVEKEIESYGLYDSVPVNKFSYDYATDDDIRKVNDIIKNKVNS